MEEILERRQFTGRAKGCLAEIKCPLFCTQIKNIYLLCGQYRVSGSLIIHFLAFKCEGFANDVISKYIVVT